MLLGGNSLYTKPTMIPCSSYLLEEQCDNYVISLSYLLCDVSIGKLLLVIPVSCCGFVFKCFYDFQYTFLVTSALFRVVTFCDRFPTGKILMMTRKAKS